MDAAAQDRPAASPKDSLVHLAKAVVTSQRRPDTDPRSPDSVRRMEAYEEKAKGLFGNSAELLTRFGVEGESARKLAATLQSGEWMFARDFILNRKDVSLSFHDALPVSSERRHSGQEFYGFNEVPTVELQFKLSNMIAEAVREAGLEPSVTDTVMAGYAGLTRYRDFGLSLQFPIQEQIDHATGEVIRLENLKDQVQDCFQNGESNALIMGGWTSSINFSRREGVSSNEPKNEADLSQQYLSRKQAEGKKAFVAGCAGPGMEDNEFSSEVTVDHPFGPHDHMLGAAAAYTLLGRGNTGEQRELDFQGHSMSGAGATALVQHYEFPDNYDVTVTAFHPATAGTNAWANMREQLHEQTTAIKKLGRMGLAPVVSGGVGVAEKMLGRMPGFTPLKDFISRMATSELFLPGDKKNMPRLVERHVDNFAAYTDQSSLTAFGSISDIPLDPDRIERVMRDGNNPFKFTLVTDRDDQMIEAVSNLRQLPADIPLFVLDDGDEGSHYAFKRNCRAMRIGLLQQSMEQLDKPQFRYLHQDLFMNVYQEKPATATDISRILMRDADRVESLFGISRSDLQTYLAERSKLEEAALQRPARPFLKQLADAGLGQPDELRLYYESVVDHEDFGLHYFYSQPDRLAKLVMPEGSAGLAKVELMMETLEQLRGQVHYNLPSDPLLRDN